MPSIYPDRGPLLTGIVSQLALARRRLLFLRRPLYPALLHRSVTATATATASATAELPFTNSTPPDLIRGEVDSRPEINLCQ